MADAARQTIQTLQEMNKNKQAQINRKQEIISDFERQLTTLKSNHQEELLKLHEEIAQLKKQLSERDTNVILKAQTQFRGYDTMTKNELSKQLNDKDNTIEDLVTQVNSLKNQLARTVQNKSDRERELMERQNEIKTLKETAEAKANKEELARLRRIVKSKEAKIDKLTKSIQALTASITELQEKYGNVETQANTKKMQDEAREKELLDRIHDKEKKLRSKEKILAVT